MRMKNSLGICLAAMAALFARISWVEAQITPLIGFTDQNWRYYEAGEQPANNNGVDWKAPTYDDGAWKTGRGFFAHEPDTPSLYNPINTSLTWSNAGASEIIRTYYFRTHF